MPRLTDDTFQGLKQLASNQVNTLITGRHGIGKTTLFNQLCEELGWEGAYINVPGSDYFVDFLGIPSPVDEPEVIQTVRWLTRHGAGDIAKDYVSRAMGTDNNVPERLVSFVETTAEQTYLKFHKPAYLQNVDAVFFDEVNREADPRFLDACMEMVQFRTINGQPLPRLKVILAAQNPPNDIYKVKELDVPLVDKFGAHIVLESFVNPDWYRRKGYTERTVASVMQWYQADLNDEQKGHLSPRTLENIMKLMDMGINPDFALLETMQVPGHLLAAKMTQTEVPHKYRNVTMEIIGADIAQYVNLIETDPQFCAFYTDLVLNSATDTMAFLSTLPVFNDLPFEYQNKCFTEPEFYNKMTELKSDGNKLPDNVAGIRDFIERLEQSAPVKL